MKKTLALVAPFALAAVAFTGVYLGSNAEANADDPKPCQLELKTKQVKAACKKGGQKEAKAMMKNVVKKGKAAGDEKMNCKSCHNSLKTYELTADAHKKLKPLL